jgi:hypothetical protein
MLANTSDGSAITGLTTSSSKGDYFKWDSMAYKVNAVIMENKMQSNLITMS